MDRYEYVKKLSDEKLELDSRIDKLADFIKNSDGKELFCPLRVLTEQLNTMRRYSMILDERIHCATA